MSTIKNNKKIVIAGIAFIAILAIFAVVYTLNKPATTEGKKQIEVEVTFADDSTKTFDITTDEEMLGQALKNENLVDGTESEATGLFIETVDGYTADSSKEEWWMISKDGESLTTGVDSTPIKDGDHFEITLTVGY